MKGAEQSDFPLGKNRLFVGEKFGVMREIRKILVIRSGAIGDFTVTIPAIRALRETFRTCELVLVARNRIRRLVKDLVNEFVDIDGPLLVPFFGETVDRNRREWDELNRFDFILSYLGKHGPISKNLESLSRPQVVNAEALPPPEYRGHMTEFLLEPLSGIVDIGSARHPSVSIDAGERRKAERYLVEEGVDVSKPLVAVHPGSGGREKILPAETFSRAVSWIQEKYPKARVLVIEGEADATAVRRFREGLRRQCITVRKDDLLEVAGVLSKACLFLGNDSGIAHLSAAVGTPTIAVFLASDPVVWAPRGASVWVCNERSVHNTVQTVAGRILGLSEEGKCGD